MYVIKRDGSKEPLNIEQIRKQTLEACKDLEGTSYEELELDSKLSFQDGISTKDIQNTLIKTAANKVDVDRPNWTYVAARLNLYDLYHRIKRYYNKKEKGDVYKLVTLQMYIDNNKKILSDWHTKYSKEEIELLNNEIDSSRDLLYDYPGSCLLTEMYLAKNDGEAVELPQHMHMAIAMFVMQNENKETRLDYVKESYHMLSKLEYINATPINANGRLQRGGLISCLVNTIEDSLDSIMSSATEVAFGSKIGGGWGIDFTRVRSLGGNIGINKNAAGGKIPFLKIFNDIAEAVNQGGSRKGVFTVHIECWDLELFDFIDLRKTSGEERRRARDLFLSLLYTDLFFQREAENGDWTLFDPKDAPLLSETYGDTFKSHYENYEKQYKEDPSKFNPNTKVVKARDVLKYHIKSWSDIGMPFIVFKDNVNHAHKHKHVGHIRSSNLCVTGDTNILTKEYGNTPIGLLVNKGIEHATCWNGNAWSYTKLFKTSDDQKVVTVEFTNGKKIKATPYHRWSVISEYEEIKITETKELRPGDTMEGYRIPNEVKDPTINDEPNTVKAIIDSGESEPTYCGIEPLNNTLIFNGVLSFNCQEIHSVTSDKYTAVCNLGSINLARVNEDKDIKRVVKLANRIMDNCIDLTRYPSDKAKKFQEDFRSCGLGSLGIAEMLANKKIHFGSDEHIKLIDYIWKLISDTMYQSSKELAKEKGGCKVDPEHRNGYLMAIAPNSSSAILAGTTNGLEPVYNKIWVEENKRGAYVMTAPHLNIENYEYYKNAYEIDIYRQIDAAAAMQQHIDMGISFNVFLEPDGLTIKSVRDIIVYAWKKKLKTLYYMRSKPPKNKEVNDNKIVCVGCVN